MNLGVYFKLILSLHEDLASTVSVLCAHKFFVVSDFDFFYSGVQKRNEIVSNLISSKKFCHSNKHVLSMDYLPTMRSICRAEKVKEQHSLRYFERKLLMLHEKCTYSNSLRFVQFMWFKHFFFFCLSLSDIHTTSQAFTCPEACWNSWPWISLDVWLTYCFRKSSMTSKLFTVLWHVFVDCRVTDIYLSDR